MSENVTDNAATITAHWRALGLPGAIDVHTHFMPDRVMAKVWHNFDHVVPVFGMQWPVTYRAPEPERLDTLRSFGITAFTSLVYPHKADMAAWLNDWSLVFASQTPGCIPTATFFAEPDAARYVGDAIDRGARVFKCHIQVGDFDPNDPLLDPVWAQLDQAQIPTIIHAGSGPAPGRHTGPEPVARLLQRFGDLPLLIAHMGMPEYGAFLDLASTYAHVYLDTTLVFTAFTEALAPFPPELHGRLADLADRILFGSDFPNIPYGYPDAVQALIDLDLGDDWLRGVFRFNAQRLFALDH